MKIQKLENSQVKITPDNGKKLIYKLDRKEHSEAIVNEKQMQYFYDCDEETERREEYGKD